MSSRRKRIVFLPLPVVLIKTQNLLFIYFNKKTTQKERKFGSVISMALPRFVLACHRLEGIKWTHPRTLTLPHSGWEDETKQTKCIMAELLF